MLDDRPEQLAVPRLQVLRVGVSRPRLEPWPFHRAATDARSGPCRRRGGTHGTAFLYWAGLPAGVRGTAYRGLAHAADLLPTLVSAVGGRLWPNETRPLDGFDLWPALLGNGTSPRASVYYGISQAGRFKLAPTLTDDSAP